MLCAVKEQHKKITTGVKMVSFECDYIAGAHPEILKRLAETNMESLPG
jgi:hypothetical protein